VRLALFSALGSAKTATVQYHLAPKNTKNGFLELF